MEPTNPIESLKVKKSTSFSCLVVQKEQLPISFSMMFWAHFQKRGEPVEKEPVRWSNAQFSTLIVVSTLLPVSIDLCSQQTWLCPVDVWAPLRGREVSRVYTDIVAASPTI